MNTTPQESLSTPSTLSPVILKLFQRRGWDQAAIREFFSWDLNQLPHFAELKDIQKAAQRLVTAITKKECIGVYGDYDVDGTTSCALLYHFFHSLGLIVETFQPSRFIEGYGLHVSSIEKAQEKKVTVLITADCGISSTDAALCAKEKNIDLIITDHHKDGELEMPVAFAVVNPSRRDEPESPLKSLSGVGVAFALCVEVRKNLLREGYECPSLYELLPFVAIGTLCDMVPLNSMNLKLVRHGLKLIPQTRFPGLLAFFAPEEREQAFIPSEKIFFHVGPYINSKGRMDHPERALKLLTAQTRDEAIENFAYLEISNRERKIIQQQVFQEAKELVLKNAHQEDLLINVVHKESWHEGVVGIVAAKLVETFEVPAVVLTQSEEKGVLKASARSVENLNLYEVLKKCEDLFLKFGGHKAAAGFSLKTANLPLLQKRLKEIMRSIPLIERTKQNHYDLELNYEEVTFELLKQLQTLEPFGSNNKVPVFRLRGARLDSFEIMKDTHVRWHFSSTKFPGKKLQGISFSYIGKWNEMHPKEIYTNQDEQGVIPQFTLSLNKFKGNEYLQLIVEKMVLA